jgi:hypothetical protein
MPSTFGARHAGFGPEYDRFRTGLSYKEVRKMLWSGNPDSGKWRYKRRGTVLGMWHQMKKEMWNEAVRRADEMGVDVTAVVCYQRPMALKKVKTEAGGGGKNGSRWVTRAEAKSAAKKIRRKNDKKTTKEAV